LRFRVTGSWSLSCHGPAWPVNAKLGEWSTHSINVSCPANNVSWPGLSRPPTTLSVLAPQDIGGRAKSHRRQDKPRSENGVLLDRHGWICPDADGFSQQADPAPRREKTRAPSAINVMAGEGPPSTVGGADPDDGVDGGPTPDMTVCLPSIFMLPKPSHGTTENVRTHLLILPALASRAAITRINREPPSHA
jgi:hypothetical protein